jgi:hypothetical protein
MAEIAPEVLGSVDTNLGEQQMERRYQRKYVGGGMCAMFHALASC